MTCVDTGEVLLRLRQGFASWRTTATGERIQVLRSMADRMVVANEALARQMTLDMGKPITQARAEIDKTVAMIQWFAEHGPGLLGDEATSIGPEARIVFEPTGTVLSVQPWNFPVWQPMRAAVPVLLGGNAFLLKPAPNTVESGRQLAALWREAGLCEGSFEVIDVEPEAVAQVIESDVIAGVTVTGGVGAGSAVAAAAGRAIKKTTLELGGSDAFIVLADADAEAAAHAAVIARFQNAGQVCIAAKRVIVEDEIAAEFTEAFVQRVSQLPVGDPFDEATFVGPLARADLLTEVDRQVSDSVTAGARVATGGGRLERPGNFYAPTVLTGVRKGMPAFDEEVFGPVAAVTTARDADHAVELANDSPFGLSASVWTRSARKAERVARQLEVGAVFVNKMVVSDPRIPIGGVRKSGYGRELSHYGLREFLNPKVIWHDPQAADVGDHQGREHSATSSDGQGRD